MKRDLKNNNIGMTLVELLIAVAIFVAAIVPMLYAFVYSTAFNFKSQQTMQSTGIAQAIIEKTKAVNTGYTDIIDSISDKSILEQDGIFTVGSVSDLTDEHGNVIGYKLENVRATHVSGDAVDSSNASRRYYDVDITFSTLDGGMTDHSTIQGMSGNTANFIDLASQLQTQDSVAQGEAFDLIVDELKNSGTVQVTTGGYVLPDAAAARSVFNSSDIQPKRLVLDRKIIIDINDSTVDVKVEYYYGGYADFNNPGDTNDNGRAGSQEFQILHPNFTFTPVGHVGAVTSDLLLKGDITGHSISGGTPIYVAELGDPADRNADGSISFFTKSSSTDPNVSAVFFYYYPGYAAPIPLGTTDSNFIDHFEINNNLTLSAVDQDGNLTNKVDFYLFKQYDDSEASIERSEKLYDPYITLNDSPFVDAYLYHNLLRYVDSDNAISSAETYSFANHAYSSPSSSHGGIDFNHSGKWHVMTVKDPDILPAGYDFIDKLREETGRSLTGVYGPETLNTFESTLLSDYASIPYRHRARSSGSVSMFGSRYKITVTVYPHGSSGAVESMSGVFLNW